MSLLELEVRPVRTLLFLMLVAVLPAGAELPGSLTVDGHARKYLLHLPTRLSERAPVPLVLVLHGGGGNARIASRLGFTELADREGFAVVYPESLGRNWNDGRETPLLDGAPDDVAYIRALLGHLLAQYPLDPDRIFVCGVSNGAIMSHRLGAELSDRIRAIAPVIGGMSLPVAASFAPERPLSVLVIQGRADPLVPFDGGPITLGRRDRGEIIPTEAAVAKWVEHNRCRPPHQATLDDADPSDGCRATLTVYPGGRDGTEVRVVAIDGAGHTWPGGDQYLPERVIGKLCRDFDATAMIWDFFKTHR